MRLFCFPHAGAGASAYRDWEKELAADLHVCRVQLPGREERSGEPAFTHVSEIAEVLAKELQPWFDRPFVFFGHSMGALIAFELTRKLRSVGATLPQHLFVSGRAAPHLPSRTRSIHHLCEAEFKRELRLLNGTPEQVLQDNELMRFLLPTLRADFSVCETYVPPDEDPLPVPITAYGGESDSRASFQELEEWCRHTNLRSTVQMFPGDHFYLQAERPKLLASMLSELAHLRTRATSFRQNAAHAALRVG
jgi:medium-chain acyl-[acyl-carrier-protein] hydrolase